MVSAVKLMCMVATNKEPHQVAEIRWMRIRMRILSQRKSMHYPLCSSLVMIERIEARWLRILDDPLVHQLHPQQGVPATNNSWVNPRTDKERCKNPQRLSNLPHPATHTLWQAQKWGGKDQAPWSSQRSIVKTKTPGVACKVAATSTRALFRTLATGLSLTFRGPCVKIKNWAFSNIISQHITFYRKIKTIVMYTKLTFEKCHFYNMFRCKLID